ncbi:GerAB/ArcD/ProY family transporter [Candidatus Clostridium radicumherbarum]|uniref:GerAB/ArcD/ProY family transporter n=1 Tax=Candidatus Clostridium radicumherbarum TaxID=3381662 RepID=A0ABW8TNS9_9CLOT
MMRNNKKHFIYSRQMMSFLISSQIGFGIITLPSTLAEKVGHDGWISVLLSGAISILCTYIISCFLKRYSNKSIFQINIFLYGKYIGMFLNFCYFLYLTFTCIVIFRLYSELIKVTVLTLTPLTVLSVFTSLPTIYLCFKGLKATARFDNTILPIYILTIILFLFISKNGRLTFAMPIGISGTKGILNGMLLSGFSFLGIELLPIIYPYVTDKQNFTKYALIANIFTTFFSTLIILISTIYVGEWKLKLLAFPLFNIITSIRVPILERLDLIFILLWYPVMGSSIRSYYFCSYHFLDILLDINNKWYPIILFDLIIIFLGDIQKDLVDIYGFTDIIGFMGLSIIGILIFSFGFSFISKRGVKLEKSKNN